MLDKLKSIKKEKILRLTGINSNTFNKILKIEELKKSKKGGKPHKLSLENRFLMTLEYWREYRTYFHIAHSYGISESSCFRNIKWIEKTLIKILIFNNFLVKKS